MNRVVPLVAVLAVVSTQARAGAIVTSASRHDTSGPLSQMAQQANTAGGATSQQAQMARSTGQTFTTSSPDPVAQNLSAPLTGVSIGANFEGMNDDDTLAFLGVKYVPPDTNGAAGATQYVQMVNVTIAVYDKATGARVLGPALISSVFSGFGGPCDQQNQAGNGGDPVVRYDQLAGRWFVSQFVFNSDFTQNEECIAVSTTSDATGSYNRYEFDFGSDFPDYPKFGVWPDAYYSSQNMFGPSAGNSFEGARACALDRAAMLAGAPATQICFQTNQASLLPSDLDGQTLPPLGAPDFFVDLAGSTQLNLFQFHADFAHPLRSSFTGPAAVAVAPFNQLCPFAVNRACVQEPTPGERLDSLDDRLMFRLAYRNFGDHESLVVNHTVKNNNSPLAGVRWYEIRSPASSPFVFQQGTVVDPNTNFWMGSIAMDRAGDIALGFSATSLSLDPSIYVTGHAAGAAAGTMTGPTALVTGTGVQENSFNRWGDYSALTVDPNDDCTFWYTNEYYTAPASFEWHTRIASFKFDGCKAHGR
jgi:hypothetical protein